MADKSLASFTDDSFDAEVIRSAQPVLVDFTARWCGPCRALTPVVAELARSWAGQVKVGQIDVDDCPRIATRFDVRSVPTLLLFKDGAVVAQVVGAVPRQKIEQLMQTRL